MKNMTETKNSYMGIAKRLKIVAIRITEFSRKLDPNESEELLVLQKKICELSQMITEMENPEYKCTKKLVLAQVHQFVLPFPSPVRDLMGFDKNNLAVVVSVHQDNDDNRWIVIKPKV